jgi:hypothetical protein
MGITPVIPFFTLGLREILSGVAIDDQVRQSRSRRRHSRSGADSGLCPLGNSARLPQARHGNELGNDFYGPLWNCCTGAERLRWGLVSISVQVLFLVAMSLHHHHPYMAMMRTLILAAGLLLAIHGKRTTGQGGL